MYYSKTKNSVEANKEFKDNDTDQFEATQDRKKKIDSSKEPVYTCELRDRSILRQTDFYGTIPIAIYANVEPDSFKEA